jgi:trehalose 6-phosphate phosphatase
VKDLLARRHRPVLRDLAAGRTLLALDFDGTLAPIVRSRSRARPSRTTAALLRAVARSWPCAVISGRSREDVRSRLGGARLVAVVGNHGAEQEPALGREGAWRKRVRNWRRRLQGAFEGIPGIDVEDKELSLTVHFRGPLAEEAARRAVLRLAGARIVPGKRVLNVVIREAPDKGQAVKRLVRRGRYEQVLFVGDDDTDEDVFRRSGEMRLVGISVGRRPRSAAAYCVREQRDVARLLRELERLRPGGSGSV